MGVVTLQPPTSVDSVFIISATATDTVTEETSAAVPFGVKVNPPPAPTINSIPSVTLTGGQAQTVNVIAVGPTGDTLRYSLSGAPDWATISATTGVVTLKPPENVGAIHHERQRRRHRHP